MKKTIILIGLFIVATTAQAQEKIKGNGNMTTKKITTPNYDTVSIAGFYDVDLVAGKEGDITIEGEENLLQYVSIEVENGTLKIATEKGKRLSPSINKGILVKVPFESLEGVSIAGSGDVNSKSTIKANSFEARVTGSGDMKLDLDATSVDATVTGSGDMKLKGTAANFTCKVTGSGDIDAFSLESKKVDTSVSGSGNCKVFCSESLEARVTGSGDIDYKGDPKKKETKVSGSGTISKA